VTTRESLPIGGREIRVPEMEQEESVRLFFRESRQRFPKWGKHLNQEELESLGKIARFMQGHPLAIKLTAALVASRSLESIRDELRKNPPKKVSDRFDVSYRSLTERQRELFSRLAVFFGSMTKDAILSICIEKDEDDGSEWESDLGELERRSFLDRVEIVTEDKSGKAVVLHRYRLHPLMRQYAATKIERELLNKLREKAANYFLGYAQNFRENFDMLEREKENILSGMNWAVSRQDSATGEEKKNAALMVLQFMSSLDSFLDTRGYWNEYGISLHQAVESAVVLGDRRELAVWVHNIGIHAQNRGNYSEARKLYQQSMKTNQELGDKSGVSKSMLMMGMLAKKTGEYDEARKLYQQSLKIDQELGDKSGMSSSLHQMGTLAQNTGEYDEARKLYQQSLKIFQEQGNKIGMALSQAQLALLEEKQGHVKEALRLIRLAEAAFRELGSPHSQQAQKDRERLEKNQ